MENVESALVARLPSVRLELDSVAAPVTAETDEYLLGLLADDTFPDASALASSKSDN